MKNVLVLILAVAFLVGCTTDTESLGDSNNYQTKVIDISLSEYGYDYKKDIMYIHLVETLNKNDNNVVFPNLEFKNIDGTRKINELTIDI